MIKPLVYHVGLTSPPTLEFDAFKILCHPLLQVDYSSFHLKEDLDEILKQDPALVLMSKNSVFGLDAWLKRHSLDSDYFNNEFWTVGERTQAHLRDVFEIEANCPSLMTGKGLIAALNDGGKSTIILICGKNPQADFIQGLHACKINFFHFPVYEIKNRKDMQFSDHFQNSDTNYIVITSPSVISGVLNNLELADLSQVKANIISIGPTTTEAIKKEKGQVFHESKIQNITSLYDDLNHVIGKMHHH
jgi:uroporphyrinogen-III synthase